MTPDCHILNPLQRDGLSQDKRFIRALHPSHVAVDERDISDLLLYAKDYASLVQYYSQENNPSGDWRKFIESDITTLVALIVKFDAAIYKNRFDNAANYRERFSPIFEISEEAYSWYAGSIKDLKLNTALERVINSVLEPTLTTAIAYAKRIDAIDGSFQITDLNTEFIPLDFDDIQADTALFPSGDILDNNEALIAIRKIKRIFQTAYESVLSIVLQAPGFLEETLVDFHKHQPHIALFLAFLKLFEIAQTHLNTITKRHLDFYYQEVLQLKLRPEQADEVHIVFELAKTFNTHLLNKDTLLKAGKDQSGANVFFGLDSELVVNKTKLFEDGLKTVFLEKLYKTGSGNPNLVDRDTPYEIRNIYAAAKANTLDGIEEELEEDGKWLTLGDNTLPPARIGFAISSPLFLLREGQRIITIVFDTKINSSAIDFQIGNHNTNSIAHELMHNIQVQYSAEKEWVTCNTTNVEFKQKIGDDIQLQIDLYIPPELPPFISFNRENLSPKFNTSYPTLYFLFNDQGLAANFICTGAKSLSNELAADDEIPSFIKTQILDFLNSAGNWIDIAAIEPQEGPVLDNPLLGTALGNEATGYDIGETTAKKIISDRDFKYGGTFKNLTQVVKVPGVGIDKMNDLYYTFCQQNVLNISSIRELSTDYDPNKIYKKFDTVRYNGSYFFALSTITQVAPNTASSFWQLIEFSNPYKYFQALNIKRTKLTVTVEGMKDLILENDVGSINPAKPFLPFGPQPKVGSKFYIGSTELFQKSLSSLTIDLEWADLPAESFRDHYNEYREDTNNNGTPNGTRNVTSNNNFETAVEILYDSQWMRSSDPGSPLKNPGSSFLKMTLFESEGADATSGSPLPKRSNKIEFNAKFAASKNSFSFSNLEPGLERGFMRLYLQKDFLHKQYPKWVTKSAISTAANKQNLVPNEPYTPTISSFSLTYTASTVIDHSTDLFEDTIERFFHVAPFGWQAFYPNATDLPEETVLFSEKLIPEFQMTDLEDPENPKITDAEGTLYIGLINLEPEQNVSILFQMAEGSANPDLPKEEISWSYLSYNQWIDFDRTQILSDTTNDLLTSGIVTLSMPKAMSDQHTILPANVYWIRVCAARKVKAISQAIAVMPQAVKASFRKEPANDLSRLSTPLPAETISKLKERQARIKDVLQPFSSFNGKLIEQNETPEGVTGEDRFNKSYNEFYIRVSERLRHKNRAVTIDDYERIILQQFPDVYKAKCINHTRIAVAHEGEIIPASEHAPGFVKIVVVPNLRNRNAVNPLQPKVSSNRLDEIKTFISPLKSDFVTLEVKNPLFEEIAVDFKVKLLPGFDKGFYTKQLQEDIVKFLSPWLYDEGADLPIGGKVHRSVILNYVEETNYVDYVTDFKLNHYIPGQPPLLDIEEAVATTSSSVIVAKAAKHHLIADVLEDC